MTLEEFTAKIPLANKAEIIATHESGLIAINKGAGLLSHPNPKIKHKAPPPKKAKTPGNERPSFIKAGYNFDREYFSWKNEDGEKMRLYLVNRLDSPTSGVIITAANEEAAKAAKAAFKEKSAKKVYYALCKGRPPMTKGVWQDLIKKVSTGRHVRAQNDRSGDIATTEFSMVRMDANNIGISLMKLEPITGKTHQLRIQCAQRHIPIVGDASYGDFDFNKSIKTVSGISRLFLHCASTTLNFKVGDTSHTFSAEAPMPDSFSTLIDNNNKILFVTRGFKR